MTKIIILQNYTYILNYQKSAFTNSATVSRNALKTFGSTVSYRHWELPKTDAL